MQKTSLLVAIGVGGALFGIGAGFLLARTPAPAGAAKLPTAAATAPPATPGAYTPVAPGTPNAIAALATKDGAAPPVPPGGALATDAPRRSITSFSLQFDAAAPAGVWDCVTAAAKQANADLATGAVEGPPLASAPCGGAGSERLEGRVRLSTGNVKESDKSTERVCDATLSYELTRADGSKEGKELRGHGATASAEDACDAAVETFHQSLTDRIAAAH